MNAPDKGTPLVERLREWQGRGRIVLVNDAGRIRDPLCLEAADRIEALEREALRLAGELAELKAERERLEVAWRDERAQLAQVTAERDEARTMYASLVARNTESALASREGWQLCPLEPTAEMVVAGANATISGAAGAAIDCYRAMLAAVKEKP